MADAYLLETGTDRFLLEDGSLLLLDDDVLDQAQTVDGASSSGILGGTSGVAAAAQSFVPTGTQILRVEVMAYKFGTPADTLYVEIQTDAAGSPSGTVVGSTISFAAAAVPAANGTWLTAAVDAAVTSGQTCWIVLRRSGAADASNCYVWERDPTNQYASGTMANQNGSTGIWSPLPGGLYDAMFRVWTAAITMSLPVSRIPRRRSLNRTRV